MTQTPNLALIGYRGTGKSTVGKSIAMRLGWEWYDSDPMVELRAGKTIRDIFAEDGEVTFRNWEAAIVEELVDLPQVVLSFGGGVVLRPSNRIAVRRCQTVVWLQASVAVIASRIAQDPVSVSQRPSLTTLGNLDEIATLLKQREPLYRECASLTVDTEGLTADQIASSILHETNWLPSDNRPPSQPSTGKRD